jgi:hypothetical protein
LTPINNRVSENANPLDLDLDKIAVFEEDRRDFGCIPRRSAFLWK